MDLFEFYQNYAEGARLTLTKAKRLEFDTTVRLIEKYGFKGSVLELGSGHGTYAEYWAQRVMRFVATDLVKENVDFMKTRFKEQANVEVVELNAVDLGVFEDNTFETVLCLGPYYHLQQKEDRIRCLSECFRVAKKNGIVAVAYINKAFAHALYLKYGRVFTREDYTAFQRGDFASLSGIDAFMGFSHFSLPSDVESEVRRAGFDVIGNFGVDGAYGLFPEALETLTDEQFQVFAKFHYSNCHEPSTLGMSSHGLVLGTKGANRE